MVNFSNACKSLALMTMTEKNKTKNKTNILLPLEFSWLIGIIKLCSFFFFLIFSFLNIEEFKEKDVVLDSDLKNVLSHSWSPWFSIPLISLIMLSNTHFFWGGGGRGEKYTMIVDSCWKQPNIIFQTIIYYFYLSILM